MPQFTHLHVHTHYSILDGMSKIGDLIDKCKRTGMSALAITDHGNMFGIKELVDTAAKVNGKVKDAIKGLKKELAKAEEANDTDAINDLKSQIEAKEKEIQDIVELLKKLEGELVTLQEQLTLNQDKLAQTNTSLTDWINHYNLSNPAITLDDISAIYHSNCDWNSIRKKKETLQDNKTSTATLLANAQKEHEEHQKSRPQKSQEELKQEQESLNQQNYTEQLVIALAKQKNHNDAEKALGSKAEELEKAGGITAFKEGFIFSTAGGLEAIYNDVPEIQQYTVDGHRLMITSNVTLRPSTYTLGVTGEYEKLLKLSREELDRLLKKW